MIRVRRNISLPVFIGSLLLSLPVAFAGNRADTGSAGVAVTKEVPHSKETVPEIMDRERTNPPPPKGDKAIRSHKIPRSGVDHCGRTE